MTIRYNAAYAVVEAKMAAIAEIAMERGIAYATKAVEVIAPYVIEYIQMYNHASKYISEKTEMIIEECTGKYSSFHILLLEYLLCVYCNSLLKCN